MRERAVRQQAEARQAAEGYIREVAGTSPVNELAKLHDLRQQGAISQEEFDRLKARVVN
jgi:hypothetical protein